MPLARACPKLFGMFSGIGILVLLAGCSAPKAGAVAAAEPASGVVEAPGHPNPAHSDSAVQSDPFVAIVRAGTITGYPQATIGQAFERAFSDAHWGSQQVKGEARVVTFTGLLPANMRPNCAATKAGPAASPCVQDAKVTFKWTFAADGRLFHLSYVDPGPWPETHRSTREMLLFIYG